MGAGQPNPRHSRTFDLLLYMVCNGGRLFTKEELMDAAVAAGEGDRVARCISRGVG